MFLLFRVRLARHQTEIVKPFEQLLKHRQVQPVQNVLPLPLVRHQPRLLQNGQVVAHRGFCHFKMLGNLSCRQVALIQQLQNSPPGRVCQGLKGFAHCAALLSIFNI